MPTSRDIETALTQTAPLLAGLIGADNVFATGRAVTATMPDGPRVTISARSDRSELPTDPLLLGRALAPKVAADLAHELALILGYHNPVEFAELTWLAAAGEVAGYDTVRRRDRVANRRRIHQIINARGLRKGSSNWEENRERAYRQVPELEPVVQLYGGRFGRWRPLADPETGSVGAALARNLIPGFGNLLAAGATVMWGGDSAQQARLAIAWLSALPGQLWAILRTGAKWGRKKRDPGPLRRRKQAPLLDNVVSTFGGAAIDVVLRMLSSRTQGAVDPALAAAITGRRTSDGFFATLSEIQSWSPMLFADLLHEQSLKVAARGEPANALLEIERDSRQLHLAIDLLRTQNPQLATELATELAEHQVLIDNARAARDKAGLKIAYLRTGAGPRGTPKVRRRFRRWMKPPLFAVGIAALGAWAFGQVAFAALALPGLAISAGTLWTMRRFHSDRVDDKADRAAAGVATQGRADDELRSAVRGNQARTGPHSRVHTWRSAAETRGRIWPELKQAALVAPPTAAAAAVSFGIDPVAPLALGLMIASTAGLFTNHIYLWLCKRMEDGLKQLREDIAERIQVRRLAVRFQSAEDGVSDACRTQLRALNQKLGQVTERMVEYSAQPRRAAMTDELAAVWDAIAEKGSAVLSRRFTTAIEAAGGSAQQIEAFLADLRTEPTASTQAMAHEFDRRHEQDLASAATAVLLDGCVAEWVKPEQRLAAVCGGELPAMDDEAFVKLVTEIAASSFAQNKHGGLETDCVLLAAQWQSALARSTPRCPDGYRLKHAHRELSAAATAMRETGQLIERDLKTIAAAPRSGRLPKSQLGPRRARSLLAAVINNPQSSYSAGLAIRHSRHTLNPQRRDLMIRQGRQ